MSIKVVPHRCFQEIYWVTFQDGSKKLATKNMVPGSNIYGERLVKSRGVEYRIWDPFRSKFAAAILNGLEIVPIKPDHKVLYLGAASGTTSSHVSDIIGGKGRVYCVEFVPRIVRDLVGVCELRPNMLPILADARLPELYMYFLERVDTIYCDIAQPQQAKVLMDNADVYLKDGEWIMFSIKARSIDVTKKPSEIYKREMRDLQTHGFSVKNFVKLEPFDKAHAMLVAKRP